MQWIFSFEDYCQIFNLDESDLKKNILDFPACVSNFNASMHAKGHKVISLDRLYSHPLASIEDYAKKHLQNCLTHNQAYQNLELNWQRVVDEFLADIAVAQGDRYQSLDSLELPFEDQQFQLLLCRDLLFHSKVEEQGGVQHVLNELCRVAEEVRIFPVQNEMGEMPEALGPILLALQNNQFGIEIKEVPYKVLDGQNAMLRIWATTCHV